MGNIYEETMKSAEIAGMAEKAQVIAQLKQGVVIQASNVLPNKLLKSVVSDLTMLNAILAQTEKVLRNLGTVEEVTSTQLHSFHEYIVKISQHPAEDPEFYSKVVANSTDFKKKLHNDVAQIKRGVRFIMWRESRKETHVIRKLDEHTTQLEQNNGNPTLISLCRRITHEEPQKFAQLQGVREYKDTESAVVQRIEKDLDEFIAIIADIFRKKIKSPEKLKEKIAQYLQDEGVLVETVKKAYQYLQNTVSSIKVIKDTVRQAIAVSDTLKKQDKQSK